MSKTIKLDNTNINRTRKMGTIYLWGSSAKIKMMVKDCRGSSTICRTNTRSTALTQTSVSRSSAKNNGKNHPKDSTKCR